MTPSHPQDEEGNGDLHRRNWEGATSPKRPRPVISHCDLWTMSSVMGKPLSCSSSRKFIPQSNPERLCRALPRALQEYQSHERHQRLSNYSRLEKLRDTWQNITRYPGAKVAGQWLGIPIVSFAGTKCSVWPWWRYHRRPSKGCIGTQVNM